MSETEEHKAIISWYRETYPQYAMSLRVSTNGMHRGKGKRAHISIAKAKGQGAVVGESDIAILLPRGGYGCLLIEHKADDAMRGATQAQLEYIEYHNQHGNCACVTKGVAMAKAAIQTYMELCHPVVPAQGAS